MVKLNSFLGLQCESSLDSSIRSKFQKLFRWFQIQDKVLVAMSGGVDSSVVSAIAKMTLGEKAVAVTVKSMTLPASDLDEAVRIAGIIGIRHVILEHNELNNPMVAENPPDRCYYCRSELVAALRQITSVDGSGSIVDGTNADDLKVHRPGVFALHEQGVRSPLAENGITKLEVRSIAKALNLPNSEKPPNACLASRFPYGQRITSDGLKRVAESEKLIKGLTGVRQLRVRDHGDIARIEVNKDDRKLFFDEAVLERIVESLKPFGFKYITFDLEGYRSGSMDESLSSQMIPSAFLTKLEISNNQPG